MQSNLDYCYSNSNGLVASTLLFTFTCDLIEALKHVFLFLCAVFFLHCALEAAVRFFCLCYHFIAGFIIFFLFNPKKHAKCII